MIHGISWPRFLAFFAMGYLMMGVGAQTVHLVYRPLDDLDELIEKAFQERLAERNNVKDANSKIV